MIFLIEIKEYYCNNSLRYEFFPTKIEIKSFFTYKLEFTDQNDTKLKWDGIKSNFQQDQTVYEGDIEDYITTLKDQNKELPNEKIKQYNEYLKHVKTLRGPFTILNFSQNIDKIFGCEELIEKYKCKMLSFDSNNYKSEKVELNPLGIESLLKDAIKDQIQIQELAQQIKHKKEETGTYLIYYYFMTVFHLVKTPEVEIDRLTQDVIAPEAETNRLTQDVIEDKKEIQVEKLVIMSDNENKEMTSIIQLEEEKTNSSVIENEEIKCNKETISLIKLEEEKTSSSVIENEKIKGESTIQSKENSQEAIIELEMTNQLISEVTKNDEVEIILTTVETKKEEAIIEIIKVEEPPKEIYYFKHPELTSYKRVDYVMMAIQKKLKEFIEHKALESYIDIHMTSNSNNMLTISNQIKKFQVKRQENSDFMNSLPEMEKRILLCGGDPEFLRTLNRDLLNLREIYLPSFKKKIDKADYDFEVWEVFNF